MIIPVTNLGTHDAEEHTLLKINVEKLGSNQTKKKTFNVNLWKLDCFVSTS